MNTRQLASRVWRSKYFILVSGALCGATAYGISLTLPNQYFATATVQFDSSVGSNVQSYSVSNKQIDKYVQTQAELVRDFRVTGRIVDRLGWTGSYDLAQQYNDEAAGSGLDFRTWLARGIRSSIVLSFEEGSPTVQIGYSGYSPTEAREMVGLIREEYLGYLLQRRQSEATENAARVDRQLAELTERMERLEERNTQFARRSDIVLDAEGRAMVDLQLRDVIRSAEVAQPPKVPTVNAANPAVRELAEVEGQIGSLSQTLGPNHPQLIELRQRQAELSKAASQSMVPPPAPALPMQDIGAIVEADYLEKAEAISTAKRYFDEIQALRAQFEKLTEKRAGFELDAQTIKAGASASGAPKVQSGVSFPNRRFAAAVGFGFGTVLATLLALLTSLMNLKIVGERDLELLDVPRIGIA